ncbi:MAG: hypothetical protein KC656_33330, partial [Myxococcales bacterium]|nr:hypothetical protein [Myxococcales bacterium]
DADALAVVPAVRAWVAERGATLPPGLSLVACRIHTGRTHQIRIHLSERGWPLAGDALYARRDRRPGAWLAPLLPEGRVMLHAWQLGFTHPTTGARVRFDGPAPRDLRAVLNAAGLDDPT